MLSPDDRQLYTDALRPPAGYRFTRAVAATYSLDLPTLLTIPLHLALFSAEQPLELLLRDGVALLESLRRTADRVTVFGHAGRIAEPAHPHVLYGLLEPLVFDVLPPSEIGSFHPKLWLLQFDNPITDERRLRLLVLSRNITADRCWDLALSLEGRPGDETIEANRELAALIERLPDLALRTVPFEHRDSAQEMADLALRTEWTLPEGFDSVRFHVVGLNAGSGWLPEASDALIVISPFLSDEALNALSDSTSAAVALVSRPEALAALRPTTLERFDRVLTLAEQAELEDGEEAPRTPIGESPSHGLHAKAYLLRRGHDTHICLGSANATNPALVRGSNIELVSELIGRHSEVGDIQDFLEGTGFGALLLDFVPEEAPPPPDEAVLDAERELDRLRTEIATSGLKARFESRGEGWVIRVTAERFPHITAGIRVSTWLATRQAQTAVSADSLAQGAGVDLPETSLQLVTSFLVFELVSNHPGLVARFTLRVEAENMPVLERDAAIVRDVIRNRDGFLRYVMLLLAEAGEEFVIAGTAPGPGFYRGARRTSDDVALFEALTRAFCRDPEQLDAIRRLVAEIGPDEEVIPPEFLDLWATFQSAIHATEAPE
jgi:hypothetical protein